MSKLQNFFSWVFVLAMISTVSLQVWNIGFHPKIFGPANPPRAVRGSDDLLTTTVASRTTTPSREYYDCLARCPTTSEYDPICGSDRVNYFNVGRLDCASRCGSTVTMVRSGACTPTTVARRPS